VVGELKSESEMVLKVGLKESRFRSNDDLPARGCPGGLRVKCRECPVLRCVSLAGKAGDQRASVWRRVK